MSGARFIIWDPADGRPRVGGSGAIVSDGIIGRVGPENAYVKIYARYPEGPTHRDLAVGQHIDGVVFSLSGTKGVYQVWRVS